eukprot:2327313-Prymnesium_polylepis.1
MTTVSVQDKRRRVVIDGHPKLGNFWRASRTTRRTEWRLRGSGQGHGSARRGPSCRTNVVLKAK